MVDIHGLAIFRCLKEQDTPETLGIVDAAEIDNDENETIRDVSKRLVENLIEDPNIDARGKHQNTAGRNPHASTNSAKRLPLNATMDTRLRLYLITFYLPRN